MEALKNLPGLFELFGGASDLALLTAHEVSDLAQCFPAHWIVN